MNRDQRNNLILFLYDYVHMMFKAGNSFCDIESDLCAVVVQAIEEYQFDNDIEE